jgi:tyrosyl-tRNA synthetase
MPNVIDVLQERGFIDAMTSEELREMAEKPFKVYCGFDPTSDSLHIGHMVALIGLAWFQRFGHTPVAIVGGATGMIGDPSGKSTERQLLTEEVIESNLQGIKKNLETLLDFSNKNAVPLILNNLDWFKNFSFIGFLRDVGKFFRIGPMLAKDSVKQRMNSEEGMSFTEFSYQLLQGYDFLHLFNTYGVAVQIGGSDQWGNITAGTDLIRKVHGKPAFGITFPLLTRSDGQKFGKSEKGAIWLSPEKCSPYEFYQYFVRVPDADAIKLMRLLTFIEMEEIRAYEATMQHTDYAPNTVQKRLAEEITRLVHGQEGLDKALKVTMGAAPGSETVLDAEVLESIAKDMASVELTENMVVGQKLVDVMVEVGLQSSKGEARRLIRNGGVYLNNAKVADENSCVLEKDLIKGRLLLLATGRKNKILVRIVK